MRVGLLVAGVRSGAVTGVGRYMVELARALASQDDDLEVVVLWVGATDPVLRPGSRVVRLPDCDLPSIRMVVLGPGSLYVPRLAQKLGLDIVHDLTGIAPFAFGGARARTVITIHDLISWAHPGTNDWLDDFLHRHWLPFMAPKCDAVVTHSYNSRTDISRYLRVSAAKVGVAYPGVGGEYSPADETNVQRVRAKYHLFRPYVLFVGSSDERKNWRRLVSACLQLWRQGLEIDLVLAGPPSEKYSVIKEELRRKGAADRLILTRYVPEADMPALYTAAEVFAYPSLYEGFGLPVIEAMACGTPVVCSNVSSIAEVADEAALTVNPYLVEALADAISRVVVSGDLRHQLRQRGLDRAREFTWERTAASTAAVYRQLAD